MTLQKRLAYVKSELEKLSNCDIVADSSDPVKCPLCYKFTRMKDGVFVRHGHRHGAGMGGGGCLMRGYATVHDLAVDKLEQSERWLAKAESVGNQFDIKDAKAEIVKWKAKV